MPRSIDAAQTDSAAFEADAAAEHRAGRQQAPGARTEQPVAPGDRAAQGLLTLRQVTGTADEHGQRLLQPREQRRERQELDTRRRQFNREGQAIESSGDPRDQGRVLLVQDETRPDGLSALGEQPHRLTARDRGDRRELRVRHPQGRDFKLLLAADVKRRPAGHHDPQRHRRLQDLRDCRSGCDQVLEVVEQDKDPRVFEMASQAIQQRPVAHIPQPDALRDRRQDQIRVPDRGQRHEIHPVREPAGDFGSQLEAKPGLAAAARARESQQAAAFQECLQILQLPLPADEAGQLAWQAIGKPIQRARRGHAAIITPKLIPQTTREPLTDGLRRSTPSLLHGSSGTLPVTAGHRLTRQRSAGCHPPNASGNSLRPPRTS